jgi:hypothetical protein
MAALMQDRRRQSRLSGQVELKLHTLGLGALLLFAGASEAAPIPVANYSFEDQVLASGGASGTISGWVQNSAPFESFVASLATPTGVDGTNFAVLQNYRGTRKGGQNSTNGSPYFYQMVRGSAFYGDSNVISYTLTVSLAGPPSHRIGVGLRDWHRATADVRAHRIVDGAAGLSMDFEDYSVTLSAATVRAGDSLQIYFDGIPAGQADYGGVRIDNVRLEANLAPAPAVTVQPLRETTFPSNNASSNLAASGTAPVLRAATPMVPDLPEYKPGEVAREDIVTPIQLIVIDAEATATLKEKEAAIIPVHCLYYTNAAAQVEREFRAAFTATRSSFLDSVEAAYQRRTLDPQLAGLPRFQELSLSFQRQNKSFPVSTNLAARWARGESDRDLLLSLAGRLRAQMNRPVRSDALPPDEKLGRTVRLVPVGEGDGTPTLESADRRGINTPRASLIPLRRAREEVLQSFNPQDRLVASFLAGLLQTNCVPDMGLTRQARARQIDPLWVADRYEPGQLLVGRGHVIDKKVKAAIDQLREKSALAGFQQKLREDAIAAAQTRRRNRVALAGLAGVFLLVGWGVWRRARRKPGPSLLPVRMAGDGAEATLVACPSCSENIVVPNTRPERPDLRARLVPQLAQLLKYKVVQRLLSQRSDFIDAQHKAAAEVADLEARLERVHAPLQERLRAYEQRIGELEKELALTGEENRELLKAKIQLVKIKLAVSNTALGAGAAN